MNYYKYTETLGLDLINLFVEERDGSIELQRDNGTRYMIMLKALLPSNRSLHLSLCIDGKDM